jgi:hypothetical protein
MSKVLLEELTVAQAVKKFPDLKEPKVPSTFSQDPT